MGDFEQTKSSGSTLLAIQPLVERRHQRHMPPSSSKSKRLLDASCYPTKRAAIVESYPASGKQRFSSDLQTKKARAEIFSTKRNSNLIKSNSPDSICGDISSSTARRRLLLLFRLLLFGRLGFRLGLGFLEDRQPNLAGLGFVGRVGEARD